ncbi:unnamed protein product [Cuscuta epithymum]|uniref:Pentatricopeptide repeat-containing protein n=2 Tax=Cuscuta epithymum TaxID=186058 RepID=A0AAV0CTE7_9ASTE|nr:unnamed protein product [Cuscuta epithymum]
MRSSIVHSRGPLATKKVFLSSPQSSRIEAFSVEGFFKAPETLTKTNTMMSSIKNQAANEGIDKSIYTILTVDRWESLNKMRYKMASLRPVHGRLTLKFLKWFIKQPGLEIDHIIHMHCITAHILIRARMYDSAKSIFRYLSEMGIGSKSVLGALMDTYCLWNSNVAVYDVLIRVYVREGMVKDALEAFYWIGCHGITPSVHTCNMILAAIARFQDTTESVWSFFKEMLAKCICPNLKTFNILLHVLCSTGKLKRANQLLNMMEESGYIPDVVTYNTLLNWLCKKGRYNSAYELIDRMACKGLEADICTYNMLIDDLCKNDRSAKGYLLLKNVSKRSVIPNEITYNTLINGFMKEGKIGVAMKVFHEMKSLNMLPNLVTFNALIDGHCRVGMFEEASGLLEEIEARGLHPNEFSYGSILNGFCRCGKIDSARYIFKRMRKDNIALNHVSYTILIQGLCKRGMIEESLKLFNEMVGSGICPDVIAYSVLVNGLLRARRIKQAKEMMCKMYKIGAFPYDYMHRNLLYNFCKQNSIFQTMKLFQVMLENGHDADLSLYNTLISCLCRCGKVQDAEDFMRHMLRIDLVPGSACFDSLISGYANIGDNFKLLSLIDEMAKLGNQPTLYTYKGVLKGLCKGGNFTAAVKLFDGLCQSSHSVLDVSIYNTLLAEACRLGYLPMALVIFNDMVHNHVIPDGYTYANIVAGLCRNGKVTSAIILLPKALEKGTLPSNRLMYTSVIDGLFKMGLPKVASCFFDEMIKQGLRPDAMVLNTMIDGYSMIGRMDQANRFFSIMKVNFLSPNIDTYNSLLHGYAKLQNISECFGLYCSISRNGLTPDMSTRKALIFALCESRMLDVGVKFVNKMIMEGAVIDKASFNMIIAKYSERGEMQKAFDVVTIMNLAGGFQPDADTYESILKGLRRMSDFQTSRAVFHEMLKNGFRPTDRQYVSVVSGMCRVGDVQRAFQFKDEMESLGIRSRDIADSAIVRGLVRRGKTEEAMLVLDCMLRVQLVPTIATFTTVIHGFCKESKVSEALSLKNAMEVHGVQPDVVVYNVLITGLCVNCGLDCAFDLYKEMKQRGVWPNITTYVVLVNAVHSDNDQGKGEQLIMDLQERGLIRHKLSSEAPIHQRLTVVMQRLNLMRKKRTHSSSRERERGWQAIM